MNGTTGYEEAAAQGLIAGVNAASAVRRGEPFVIERRQAYIGVLIDDLVTRGVTEPYRMFTSRAEYRLLLRADNADERLTPLGLTVGCVENAREKAFHVKQDQANDLRAWARATTLTPPEARRHGIAANDDGKHRSILDLLALPDQSIERLSTIWPRLQNVPNDLAARLEADALYAGYLERQEREVEEAKRYASLAIPPSFDFATVPGLSNEVRGRLDAARPDTLEQASRLEGMTPTALAVLLVTLRKAQPERKTA